MSRSALPQNYIKTAGTTIEEFDIFEEWTVDSATNGSIEADTEYYHGEATQGLKINALANKTCRGLKSVTLDLSNVNVIRVWVYIPDAAKVSNISIRFLSDTGPAYNRGSAIWQTCLGQAQDGWNHLTMHKNNFRIVGDLNWSNIVQIQPSVVALTENTSATFCEMDWGGEFLPRILIQFDDAAESQYTTSWDWLYGTMGFPATIWVPPAKLGTTGYMSKTNLDAIYTSGWSVGGHGYTHANLATASSAVRQAELSNSLNWLLDNGYTRAAHHMAYPFGATSAATQADVANVGFLTARGTSQQVQPAPPGNMYNLYGLIVLNTHTLAQIKAWIDQAAFSGAAMTLIFHGVKDADLLVDTDILTSTFQAIINYAIERGLKFVTIDEWYQGLTNPRYRSVRVPRTLI